MDACVPMAGRDRQERLGVKNFSSDPTRADGLATGDASPAGDELVTLAATLMQSRQTILPKHLMAPGPDDAQLALLLQAAASAPDHGRLLPWRFVVVPPSARARLAEVFGAALIERDPSATAAQVNQACEKAHRAPLLMLAVVDGQRGDPAIDLHERTVSAGCAVQNMLLMATALGFGSALTSGKALRAAGLRALFGLNAAEIALCFISVGRVRTRKPGRLRPLPSDFVSCLPDADVSP